ncbi:MAG: HAD-IC family P-type ATPase [Candidatus Paceibacterota bacterium]
MKKPTEPYYSEDTANIATRFKTDPVRGLANEEATRLLLEYGQNSFQEGKKVTLFDSFLAQIKNPLIYILLAALGATLLLHEYLDAIVIAVAIAINVIIGVFQENRAYRAFEKLSESQEKQAIVIRDGEQMIITSTELVPGDVVVIHAGMSVPADIRVLESKEIDASEAPLTGEAKAVHKTNETLRAGLEVTEQENMLFMGTLILAGHGKGIVVRTGNETEIGKIAESLANVETTATPVQESLHSLAQLLAKWVLLIVVFVFVLGLLQGRGLSETLLISIAIAVSILPEGLPASVTVVLAIGVEKILKKGGLVKNLLAAETLGSATVILTDKTGTLTQAHMTVSNLITAETLTSEVIRDRETELSKSERELLRTSLLTTDAFITKEAGVTTANGRPIEKALLEAGIAERLTNSPEDPAYARINLFSFESKNKFSASLNRSPEGVILLISGAPELALEHSTFILQGNHEEEMTDDLRKKFLTAIEQGGANGKRFIGIARKKYDEERFRTAASNSPKDLLSEITFVGLIGFEDPIREDVPDAVRTAREAGARVIMVTGDLRGTARSVAIQSGIATPDDSVMLGKQIDELNDEELLRALKTIPIFSRVLPHQKLRISEVLQRDGEVVAMTGDGINDAPALRGASIGIAVESGTEVAKEASDIILLKNSFAIIIAAVEEGRRIITNLKKIVGYLLSTNLGEAIAIVGSLVIALPVPLLPAQILWVNIIGEGLLNFALAFEPAEKGSMKQPPQKTGKNGVLTKRVWELTLIVGITTGTVLLALYVLLLERGMDIEKIRTIMFVALSFGTTLYAFSFRSFTQPLFKTNPFSNPYLIASAALNLALLTLSVSLPPLQKLLSLSPINGSIVMIALTASFLNLLIIEISKAVLLSRSKKDGGI